MIRILFLFFCTTLSFSILAEDKAPSISPWLYKKLQKSEQLIGNKSYTEAEKLLNKALPETKSNTYQQALVLRSLSSVYALKGQYKKAAELLSKALKGKALPEKQLQQATLNLGQLYMASEQYRKAIAALQPWLKQSRSSDPQINALIANAYAQLKKYRQALPFIKKAISQNTKPVEDWYQLNLALYYELQNYHEAAKILKRLITLYPKKKQYWEQLASTYQQLKQYKKAASVQHLAYQKGFVATEKKILELVNLFLFVDSPYKAAALLKKNLDSKKVTYNSKNWETLAHAWSMAKEFKHAIQALNTASRLNDKGRLYQQLGEIYVEQEQWSNAIDSFNKALKKGGLKNTGSAYLLLGMSYFENNNKKAARKAFSKAAQYSKNRKAAKQWLNYIREDKNEI